MKTIILAGGYGTRLSEETDIRPKPMVEIGGRPILWHIMVKIYSHYGFNDFVVLLGYKGYYIKEYFANYFLHQSDVRIDMSNGQMEVLNNSSEPWKVTLLDTGLDSMTGGRIKRAQDFIGNEPFMLVKKRHVCGLYAHAAFWRRYQGNFGAHAAGILLLSAHKFVGAYPAFKQCRTHHPVHRPELSSYSLYLLCPCAHHRTACRRRPSSICCLA